MSPASSGALEIERYIGACLISNQQTRHKVKINNIAAAVHHHQGFVDNRYHQVQRSNSSDGWAGGMPLISFNNAQRWRRQENHNPLARLAVHTQGAPLILSNRYNHRKNKHPRNSSSPKETDSVKTKPDKDVGTDAVSVTSDESSGSANSENSLPRIIKPRKRRKKDRKPPHLMRPISQDGSFSTDSSNSPDIDLITFMPYFPYNYDFSYKSASDSPTNNIVYGDISEAPNLHHSFEDVEDFDVNGNQTESSCQCRYCDPEGQIWDIDRSCYSPYLTSAGQKSFQYPETSLLSKSYSSSSMSSSLAETMSSLSLDDDCVGKSAHRSSRDLEVSTEIVTSLNGHRDLEIKFFSPKDVGATEGAESETNKVCSVNICSSFVTEE